MKTNNQPEGQLVETGTNRLYATLLKNNHTIDITRRRNKFLKKSNLSQYVCKNELHLEKSTSLRKLRRWKKFMRIAVDITGWSQVIGGFYFDVKEFYGNKFNNTQLWSDGQQI